MLELLGVSSSGGECSSSIQVTGPTELCGRMEDTSDQNLYCTTERSFIAFLLYTSEFCINSANFTGENTKRYYTKCLVVETA